MKKKFSFLLALCMTLNVTFVGDVFAQEGYVDKTFDFSEGVLNNLTSESDGQIQIDDTTKPFGFIWVAVSSKGTAVKIDTDTGAVLGEYYTAPSGQPKNPSRTTVDKNGSVWLSNRDGNSVTRICLPESGLWIDKNHNGKCDTSVGLGDIKPWTNAGGADTNGGVSTAEDECITNYVRVSSSGTRHVSVNADNDVWVTGTGSRVFNLVDGKTGAIKRTEGSVGYGGYGGLIDKNGVIWSANPFLRWDTSKPLTGPLGTNWLGYNHDSYGLGIDYKGNVWNTSLNGDQIRKFAPDGTLVGTYSHGSYYAQGCVADANGDIWVAGSLYGNTVGHLKNDGTFVGNVTVGNGPTGVAVDSKGKIWATNYNSRTVSRIDPTKGPIGSDGVTHVGEVDFTTVDLGGNLYNYSDMTGSTLIGAPNFGSWNVVYDSKIDDLKWGGITWDSQITEDGAVNVFVQGSNDGVNYTEKSKVENGQSIDEVQGRYLKVEVDLIRSSSGVTPTVSNLNIKSYNTTPELAPIGDKVVDENQLLQFKVIATDIDGDSVKLSASNLPDGAVFDSETGIFTWTPTYDQAGEYENIKFEATDDLHTVSEIIKIKVNDVNRLPEVKNAKPSIDYLWSPNHKFVNIDILGVTDPDGDEVTINITKITSDEVVADGGNKKSPDATGVGTSVASVKAERLGSGNGRVYEITFTATDSKGGVSTGSVKVYVPHDQSGFNPSEIDDGQKYDATVLE